MAKQLSLAAQKKQRKGTTTIKIDQRKFATFIRHFGEKFKEGDEDAYMLSMPMHVWAETPKNSRVIAADMPPMVQFVTFVDSEG
jgi:hypothetical protein